MSDEALYNVSNVAGGLAHALMRALKEGHLSRIGIDQVRAAILGYTHGWPLPPDVAQRLEDRLLRKVIEAVG